MKKRTPPASSRKVTQADIARSLGVDQTTVSLALRGEAVVSEKTRKRVVEAAARMGYRRNALGKAMRDGRFGAIALLESTDADKSPLSQKFYGPIHDALAERDMRLTIARLPDADLTQKGYMPKIMTELSADGLVVNFVVHIPDGMIEAIKSHSLPSVWMNVDWPENCVRPDDEQGARVATERLLDLGHRDVAYLDYWHHMEWEPSLLHYSALARSRGYAGAMRAAGARPREIHWAFENDEAAAIAFTREVLEGPDRPSAMIAYGMREALPIVHVAAVLGLRIPDDLSLVVFEREPASILGVDVCTMLIPVAGMGRRAIEMLERLIARPERPLESVVLAYDIDAGGSCARPAGRAKRKR